MKIHDTRMHQVTTAGGPPQEQKLLISHSSNTKWSAFCQACRVSLQSSWSSSRRTAGSRAGGRTCLLTLETSTQSSCSSPHSSTTSSGSLPSIQWARVSPAAPHHDIRPVEQVRRTACSHLTS